MTEKELSPKMEKKRNMILNIARKVFAKEGYRNTDVQVIADLAKVGKGTVYRHFGNKEQLFLAVSRHCLEGMGEYLTERVQGMTETPSLLREIAIGFAEYYQKNPQAVEILIQERAEFRESVFPSHLMYRAETRQEFEAFLQQSIEKGIVRDVNVTEATNAFADLLYGSVINGCLEGGKRKLVERVTHATDIFLHGLLKKKD